MRLIIQSFLFLIILLNISHAQIEAISVRSEKIIEQQPTVDYNYSDNLSLYLDNRLQNVRKFSEIQRIVDSLYATLPDKGKMGGYGLPKYKHWSRWFYHTESRLNGKGEIFDFHKIDKHEAKELNKRRQTRNKWSYLEWQLEGITKTHGHPKALKRPDGKGRIDRIGFHPTDANTFYVGTPNSGVWKTTDGGSSWEKKNQGLPNLGVSGIVVHKDNPETVYVLTGTGDNPSGSVIASSNNPCEGVYKSTNGGNTWTPTAAFPLPSGTNLKAFDLLQSPLRNNTILAATDKGIMISYNGGDSWAQKLNIRFYDVEFHPTDSTIMYAASADKIYYSNNNGIGWAQAAVTFDIIPVRIALRVTPAAPNEVLALAGSSVTKVDSATYRYSGFYKSTNKGIGYGRLSNSPNVQGYDSLGFDLYQQANYDHCFVINPNDKDSILLATVILWESGDGGTTFNKAFAHNGKNTPNYIHPDQHDAKINPLDNKLYLCNDGGIYVSENFGKTWKDIGEGIHSTMVYNLTLHHETSFRMGVGLQDNGYKYRDTASTEFTHVGGGDGFDFAYAGAQRDIYYKSTNNSLWRDTISVNNEINIHPPGANNFGIKLATSPANAGGIFAGGGPRTFISSNYGASWVWWNIESRRGMDINNYDSTNRLMIAGANGVFYNDNFEGFLHAKTNPNTSSNKTVTCISMDNFDINSVAISYGGYDHPNQLFYSNDGGTSWDNLTGSLSSFITTDFSINTVELHDSVLYVGTNNAIYETPVDVIAWSVASMNLPNVPFTDIEVNPHDGTIVVGTWGYGIWSLRFCPGDIDLKEELIGEIDYHTNGKIQSISEIEGLSKNKITMQSAQEVILLPGFRAKTNSTYIASIDNCIDK